jgi:hypothetical protein
MRGMIIEGQGLKDLGSVDAESLLLRWLGEMYNIVQDLSPAKMVFEHDCWRERLLNSLVKRVIWSLGISGHERELLLTDIEPPAGYHLVREIVFQTHLLHWVLRDAGLLEDLNIGSIVQ